MDHETGALTSKQYHAARMAQRYGCAHIAAVEDVLHGHHVGGMTIYDLGDAVKDFSESRGKVVAGPSANHTAFDESVHTRRFRDYESVAGNRGAGIHA